MFLLQVVNAECTNRSSVTAVEPQSSVPSKFNLLFMFTYMFKKKSYVV